MIAPAASPVNAGRRPLFDPPDADGIPDREARLAEVLDAHLTRHPQSTHDGLHLVALPTRRGRAGGGR